MKKNYIKPTSNLVHIETSQMLATSGPKVNYDEDGKADSKWEPLCNTRDDDWEFTWE